jgi:hypothetical protein
VTHTRQNPLFRVARRVISVAAVTVAASAGIALAVPSAAVAGSGAEPTKGAASRTAPIPAVAPAKPGTNCTVDAKLVPSCNVLWGAAAGGFSETPRDQALREWEAKSGRTASIYHTYHRGNELFPTKAEIAMANEVGKKRILFTNWKVGFGTKWGRVAAGEQDARIDKLSAHIRANYGRDRFFLAVHHEPENDVSTDPKSQMTARDYANMVRYTVKRMRSNGVTNVVFVMAYMNVEKWNDSPWWPDLYPGGDVIDWVAVDSYVNAQPKGFHAGDFTYLMNRTTGKSKFNGWYNWALTTGKPIMVAEWAVYECRTRCSPTEKAKIHAKVVEQMKAMPAIKAMVAFDTASDQQGLDMRIDSTPQSLASFKKIATDPIFNVNIGR